MSLSAFSFNGTSTTELSVIITKTPAEVLPERDVEIVSIPGRHGDLVFDNGRYKNVSRVYECAVLPRFDWEYDRSVRDVCDMLRPTAGYFRLEDTYQPDIFRLARSVSKLQVESIVQQAGIFTAEFDCKPQKFLKDGEMPRKISAATSIYNACGYPATPMIEVFGNGPGELSVGGITVQIKELEGSLTLDCELQNAYTVDGAGGMTNQNASIFAPAFPVLKPGENGIVWNGGVEYLKITPRWWTL